MKAKVLFSLVVFSVSVSFCHGQAPSADEVRSAVTANGGNPRGDQIDSFINGVNSLGASKREAAMILAHMIHESTGLAEKTERECQERCNKNQYRGGWHENVQCEAENGRIAKCYCGRGYLQLTWCNNYKTVGDALGRGDIVDNPEVVANDEGLSWATSFKYWELNVRSSWKEGVADQVRNGMFGASTNAINGDYECKAGGDRTLANIRFEKYKIVMREFHINEAPNPEGC